MIILVSPNNPRITMGKSSNFFGQPIFGQLIKLYFQDRSAIIAALPRFRSVAEKARESRIAIEFTGNTKE